MNSRAEWCVLGGTFLLLMFITNRLLVVDYCRNISFFIFLVNIFQSFVF